MSYFLIIANSHTLSLQVGFCNVIKKAKDQMNHLWVAEATENSTYFLDFKSPIGSHLRNAAVSVETWAKISPMVRIIKFRHNLTKLVLMPAIKLCLALVLFLCRLLIS